MSRILSLIESAQQQKAPAQRFTDAFSRYYTWFALSLAAVVFAVLVFLQHAPSTAFYRAMTVLVVASPCALCFQFRRRFLSPSPPPRGAEFFSRRCRG